MQVSELPSLGCKFVPGEVVEKPVQRVQPVKLVIAKG